MYRGREAVERVPDGTPLRNGAPAVAAKRPAPAPAAPLVDQQAFEDYLKNGVGGGGGAEEAEWRASQVGAARE